MYFYSYSINDVCCFDGAIVFENQQRCNSHYNANNQDFITCGHINFNFALIVTLAHPSLLSSIFNDFAQWLIALFIVCLFISIELIQANALYMYTVHLLVPHIKERFRWQRCHCWVRLEIARIMCCVRSFHLLLKGPMICGLDLTITNCLNVMIAISSIEFFPSAQARTMTLSAYARIGSIS